jgi:hypothetical protein
MPKCLQTWHSTRKVASPEQDAKGFCMVKQRCDTFSTVIIDFLFKSAHFWGVERRMASRVQGHKG